MALLKPLPRPPFKYIFTDPKDISAGLPTQQFLEFLDSLQSGLNFQSGKKAAFPWVNVVTDFGAVGNGIANDQPAIQAACNFINSQNGGIVLIPVGNYIIGSPGLTVNGSTILLGVANSGTGSVLNSLGADVATVTFASGCNGGARDLLIYGFQNAAATNPAVTVAAGAVECEFFNVQMQYGKNGLKVAGGDNDFNKCTIFGYNASIESSGQNWYRRCKIDNSPISSTYAFHQVASGSTDENSFVNCDLSGTYTNSIFIDDTNAITKFVDCITSSAIQIHNAKFTLMSCCEFGNVNFTVDTGGGALSVSSCVGQGVTITIGVTAPATKTLAACINIT